MRDATRLQEAVRTFIVSCVLADASSASRFIEGVPDILGSCNAAIYDRPLRAEAYAAMHLLERYRRTWRILEELTRARYLPLARHGVHVLDVGTGPAPVLYAVSDFYGALDAYADREDLPELRLPPPTLAAVEGSQSMQHVFHLLSEITSRPEGPFSAAWSDFETFSGHPARAAPQSDTVDIEEGWAFELSQDVTGPQSYRLCVFSNFLTTPETVDRFEQRISTAIGAVSPGGIVLMAGSAAKSYDEIYGRLDEILGEHGLRKLRLRERFDPPDPDPLGILQKALLVDVWARLAELLDVRDVASEALRTACDPEAPYRTRPFALRAYRRDGQRGSDRRPD